MDTLDLIRATALDTNTHGAAFYFHPDTLARGKELGLDGFRFYVLGRGGVLGDVDPAVITSAFAYFHPAVIAKIWGSAKEKVAPATAAAAYQEACAALGRSKLADVDGLDAYVEAAEAVIAAADPAGLALFAGWAAEPRADDTPARALQCMAVLRELRGSAHIVALVASGLSPAVAHAIKRPDDTGTFGWDPAPEITDADRTAKEAAEELTDRLLVPSHEVLDDSARSALAEGTKAIATAMS